MRTRPSRPFWLLPLLALAACVGPSSMRVQASQSPTVDLSSYRTYAWSTPSVQRTRWRGSPSAMLEEDDPVIGQLDSQIRGAVDAELARRGYAPDDVRPDFVVSWNIVTRERELGKAYGDYARYLAEGGREEAGKAWVFGYEEGSLVVDVHDAQANRLVWTGSATAVVNASLRQQRLPLAVRRMFADFPSRR